MAERRPLAKALDLPAEKLDFIHGTLDVILPITRPTGQAESPPTAESTALAEEESKQPRAGQASQRSNKSPRLPSAHPSGQPLSLLPELRAALTTRLRPETADALRRASLEQRLNRRRPSTQQEIVEAALREWLRKNEYFD